MLPRQPVPSPKSKPLEKRLLQKKEVGKKCSTRDLWKKGGPTRGLWKKGRPTRGLWKKCTPREAFGKKVNQTCTALEHKVRWETILMGEVPNILWEKGPLGSMSWKKTVLMGAPSQEGTFARKVVPFHFFMAEHQTFVHSPSKKRSFTRGVGKGA